MRPSAGIAYFPSISDIPESYFEEGSKLRVHLAGASSSELTAVYVSSLFYYYHLLFLVVDGSSAPWMYARRVCWPLRSRGSIHRRC